MPLVALFWAAGGALALGGGGVLAFGKGADLAGDGALKMGAGAAIGLLAWGVSSGKVKL